MNERTGDLVAGIAGIVFAAFLVAVSLSFPEPGPKWMPWFVAGLIGIGSVILILRRLKDRQPGGVVFADVHWAALLVLLGSWIVTVLLLETVGFYLMLALFMGGMSWFLQGCPRRIQPILISAVYGVAASLAMWGLFTVLLGTTTPSGIAF